MKSNKLAKFLVAVIATAGVIWSSMAVAIDWNITGFVRQEISISVTGQENENNQSADRDNLRIQPHYTSITNSPANHLLPKRYLSRAPFTGVGGIETGANLNDRFFDAGANTTDGLGFARGGAGSYSPYNCRFGSQNMRNIISGGRTLDPIPGQDGLGAGTTFTPPGPGDALGEFASEGFLGLACPNAAGGISRVGGLSADPSYVPPAGLISNQVAGQQDDFDVNMFNTRAEIDVQARVSRRLSGYMKLRAYFWAEDQFTNGRVGDHFSQNDMFHGNAGNILEVSGGDLLLDIPALYFDYNNGPLWIRVGQQTIAWGEALFFRVMDVANGLDLRRQLIGVAAEEFSDQRVASPAIRMSYTFDNGFELDSFAQMFSPTLLPGQNTPYNIVPHGVNLQNGDEFEDAENSINFGFRLTAPVTDNLTLLAMYTNRRNPDGVVRWGDAPRVWNGQVNPFCGGPRNDTFQLLKALDENGFPAFGHTINPVTLGLGTAPSDGSCGVAVAPDPWAANSTEFLTDAPAGRLDPVTAIRSLVDESHIGSLAVREAFGFGSEVSFYDALTTAEGFHNSFGGFRGWVTREYKREQIFAVGGNYIVNSENEWLDQLIIRGEVAVTPDKQFTNSLSRDFIEETEVVSALILEKYQRFSDAFPATYLVAQWMHRTSSDLFGRHLSGQEGKDIYDFLQPDGITLKQNILDDYEPDGQSNSNYIAVAFQQPFPNLVWRLDFAMLIDVQGGVLFQPGVRYRPSADWQFDLYATVVEDLSSTKYDTIMETIDFNDEVFARITWFF